MADKSHPVESASNVGVNPPRERFLQAADACAGYFSDISSRLIPLQQAAQNFDFVTNPSAPFEGDRTSVINAAADNLRAAMDEFEGPEELADVYAGLYTEQINVVLGPREE